MTAPPIPREDWLASPNADVYVAAISLCQSGDPSWCSAHGKCRNDGECFPGGRIVHERRELRFYVGELLRLGRELRQRIHVVERTNPRALKLVATTCPHCGREQRP